MSNFVRKYHNYLVKQRDNKEQEYLQNRVFLTIEKLFQKILKKEFKGRLLDLGCGDGSFVKVCKKQGIEAIGIDIKDGVNFEIDKLPYNENSFDTVFMYSVIEHLYNPSNILEEIQRVLKPGGVVVIITPSLKYAKYNFYNDPTHIKPYTSRSLAHLMNIYGFGKLFMGLWTVKKSPLIWKLPEKLQFIYGATLPFSGLNRYVPRFLKGKSTTILSCFKNIKQAKIKND